MLYAQPLFVGWKKPDASTQLLDARYCIQQVRKDQQPKTEKDWLAIKLSLDLLSSVCTRPELTSIQGKKLANLAIGTAHALDQSSETGVYRFSSQLTANLDDLQRLQRFLQDNKLKPAAQAILGAQLDILIADGEYQRAKTILESWLVANGKSTSLYNDPSPDLTYERWARFNRLDANSSEKGPAPRSQREILSSLLEARLIDARTYPEKAFYCNRLKPLLPMLITEPNGSEYLIKFLEARPNEDNSGSIGKLFGANWWRIANPEKRRIATTNMLSIALIKPGAPIHPLADQMLSLYRSQAREIWRASTPFFCGDLKQCVDLLIQCNRYEDANSLLELFNDMAKRDNANRRYVAINIMRIQILANTDKAEQALAEAKALRQSRQWQSCISTSETSTTARYDLMFALLQGSTPPSKKGDFETSRKFIWAARDVLAEMPQTDLDIYFPAWLDYARVAGYNLDDVAVPELFRFVEVCKQCKNPKYKRWQILAEMYLASNLRRIGKIKEARALYKAAMPALEKDIISTDSVTLPGGYCNLFVIFLRAAGMLDEANKIEALITQQAQAGQ
jgi:hypothetical protein